MEQLIGNATTPAWTHLNARAFMQPIPKSLSEFASVRDATLFLIDQKVTAAPVMGASGKVIGVISMTHILSGQRSIATPPQPFSWERYAKTRRDFFEKSDLSLTEPTPENLEAYIGELRVRDVMDYHVFSVDADASAVEVVRCLLDNKVHRVFVTENSTYIGLISTFDILQSLI